MSSPYTYIADAAAFSNLCEAWVENQLLGHTGVYPDALAGTGASDFVHTSDPNAVPAGVAVVFGAAPSNDNYGHVGVSLGGGVMQSVWSNGKVEQEPIAQFVQDNGAPLLGYHRFGMGVPAAPSSPTPSAPSPVAGFPIPGKWLLLGVAGVAIAWALGD